MRLLLTILVLSQSSSPSPYCTVRLTGTLHSGVFDTAGEIPLQLLVDIKTDGVE